MFFGIFSGGLYSEAQAQFRDEAFPALQALQARTGADISGVVFDLQKNRVLMEINSAQGLIPASLSKLYVAGLALETWGQDKRFATRLLITTPLRENGKVAGELIFQGGGDPGLGQENLWKMARLAYARGLREIDGDLIVDQSLFGAVPCDTQDRCDALRQSGNAYDAQISSAAIDFGTASISITSDLRPGKESAKIQLEPIEVPSLRLLASVALEDSRSIQLIRIVRGDSEEVTVKGHINSDITLLRYYRSLANPARHTGEMLKALLMREGIKVAGDVQVSNVPVDGRVVLEIYGKPLHTLVQDMLYYSNNFMADVMLLHLALEQGQRPPLDIRRASGLITAYARAQENSFQSETLKPQSSPLFWSGSGLSTDSTLSSDQLITLLRRMYQNAGLFPHILGSLRKQFSYFNDEMSDMPTAVANLERAGLAAKTGSLSEPFTVQTIAGYFRLANGNWATFAILVNGSPENQQIPREDIWKAFIYDLNVTLQGQ